MNNLKFPVILFLFFLFIASLFAYLFDNIFYLFNFLYIGSFASVGVLLFLNNKSYGRLLVQWGVGLYMLVLLGFIAMENMQLSGFFYYLFLGVFQAAVIHYLIAKIGGPVLFGRGWCGYACWTGMVLDILPYKTPKTHERVANLGILRYLVFLITLLFVATLFYFNVPNLTYVMFLAFVIGNLIYYGIGIALAYILKDNRAFCKYVCPIVTFLKPASYFSLLRTKVNKDTCNSCNICVSKCPMDVDILDKKRSRKNGTECILCLECVKKCPTNSIKL